MVLVKVRKAITVVLVCGDREWKDRSAARYVLEKFNPQTTIIVHGDCRGADRIAGEVASEMGFVVRAYPAKWDLYGKRAGPIRNTEMLDKEHPDIVFAFHNNIERSRGTKDMITKSSARGIPVELVMTKRRNTQ